VFQGGSTQAREQADPWISLDASLNMVSNQFRDTFWCGFIRGMIVHEAVTDDEDQADSMDEVEALGEENVRHKEAAQLAHCGQAKSNDGRKFTHHSQHHYDLCSRNRPQKSQ
jgi:hypothetical protein